MRDLLFLSHRIPYPPDKGDKIRAWNFLRHLASDYRVHLGFFIDAPEDVRLVEPLREICASVFWRPLSPRRARLRSLRGLLTGDSLTRGYFGDRAFAGRVDEIVTRHRPSRFYVSCSAMAPYVAGHRAERYVLDMCDVDSEKWRQYAASKPKISRPIYTREGRRLLALERQAAVDADAVVLASQAEALTFRRLAPESSGRICHINNGVDTTYFDPDLPLPNPFDDRPAVVFTGAMDYWPNVQAVTWFVEEVMPGLRLHPAAPHFWIVGSNPSPALGRLAGPDVHVTGRVPDIRPYLAHARAVVAPLQIARGVQNKVLEAMAMGAAIVVTPQARAGLDCDDDDMRIASSPGSFGDAVSRILDGQEPEIGSRARARVLRDYAWQASFAALDQLIGDTAIAKVPAGQLDFDEVR